MISIGGNPLISVIMVGYIEGYLLLAEACAKVVPVLHWEKSPDLWVY